MNVSKTYSKQALNSGKKNGSTSKVSGQQRIVDLAIKKIEKQIAQNKEKQHLACDFIAHRVLKELQLDVANPFSLNIEHWFEYQKEKQTFFLKEMDFVRENHPAKYQEAIGDLIKIFCIAFEKIDDELIDTENKLKKSKDIANDVFNKFFSERTKFEYAWLKEVVDNLKNETNLYIQGAKDLRSTAFVGDMKSTKEIIDEKTSKVYSLAASERLNGLELKNKFLKDVEYKREKWGQCFSELLEPMVNALKEEEILCVLATKRLPDLFLKQYLPKLSGQAIFQLKLSAVKSLNEKMIEFLNFKPGELLDDAYFEEVSQKFKQEPSKRKGESVDFIKKPFSHSVLSSCKSQMKFWDDYIKNNLNFSGKFDYKKFVSISLMNNLVNPPQQTDILDMLSTIMNGKLFEAHAFQAHFASGLAFSFLKNVSAPMVQKKSTGSQRTREVFIAFMEKYEYSNLVLGVLADTANKNGYTTVSEVQALTEVLGAVSRSKNDYVIKSIFDQNLVDSKGVVCSQVNVFESLISAAVKSRLGLSDPKMHNFLKAAEVIIKCFADGNPNATKIIETSFENCFSGARAHATRTAWKSWLEAHLLSLKLNDEIGLPNDFGKKQFVKQRL